MDGSLWFNLWRRRLWPYEELGNGDTVYWFETRTQRIVWKTRVERVEAFEYDRLKRALDRLDEEFGVELDRRQPYLDGKPESGFCLGYRVAATERLAVPKPSGLRFSQNGWERGDRPEIAAWLRQVPDHDDVQDPPGTVEVLEAPVEGGGVATYEATATIGGTRTRREADLVAEYQCHMQANGHQVTGRHYRVPGEARLLRADLYVADLNLLVEAKGTTDRNAIRLAIGQVADYRRFQDPRPHTAVLLPGEPGHDMLTLLDELHIGCIWPVGQGFADNCDGSLTR